MLKSKEDTLTNTSVDVKRSAPAASPASVPDSWQILRTEVERLFDRFGFGVKPFRDLFELEPPFEARTTFEMPLSRY